MNHKPLKIVLFVLALAAASVPAFSQGKGSARKPKPKPNEVSISKAKVAEAAEDYKDKLAKVIEILEARVNEAAAVVAKREEMFALGIVAKRDLQEAESVLAAARSELDEKQRELTQTDNLIAEAKAAEQLAMLPPAPVGSYSATAALIRYNGPSLWTLADAVKVQGFFTARFARALPVSAFGQTAVHDRLGFDHRNSLDVAIHPDSSEGQALMAYLRSAGIPFIAFRQAVAGSATGAHIHIGYPSRRFR